MQLVIRNHRSLLKRPQMFNPIDDLVTFLFIYIYLHIFTYIYLHRLGDL